jgi:hypothetical protein
MNDYILVKRVAGYYGFAEHVIISEYVNETTQKVVFKVELDELRTFTEKIFEKKENILQLQKIVTWLYDRSSKVKSNSHNSLTLTGVKFSTKKPGYEIEEYDRNPYEEKYSFEENKNEEIINIFEDLYISLYIYDLKI